MIKSPKYLLKHLMRAIETRCSKGLHDTFLMAIWECYGSIERTINHINRTSQLKEKPRTKRKGSYIKVEYSSDFFFRHIAEHILPFWAKYSIDHKYGGFITHLNRKGEIYDTTEKLSPMQGRMIYAFCIGYDLKINSDYIKTAKQGLRFLLDNFWDEKFGGWYRSVYRDGSVKDTDKHLFDQAYVLIGLAEYYRLTGDKQVYEYIAKSYEVINQNGWDWENQGYYERCSREWSEISPKKTICVHLDILTAIMSMYGVDEKKAYLNRLEQITDLIINRMCDPKYFCLLETFHKHWMYNPLVSMDKIQFGHNLKGACLLLELYRLTGNSLYYRYGERLINFCIKFGWDKKHHGFYQDGYRNGKVSIHEKLWWPMCEGLSALLLMYTITSDELYLDYFKKLASFSLNYFFDKDYGEWITSCYDDGTVNDDRKGYEWKAAFHTVQACFNAYRLLKD